MGKNFKTSAAELFMTSTEEPIEETYKAPETVKKGYQIIPEYKTARMQLLLKPSTKKDLKILAANEGISLNELCNKILEDYIERSN